MNLVLKALSAVSSIYVRDVPRVTKRKVASLVGGAAFDVPADSSNARANLCSLLRRICYKQFSIANCWHRISIHRMHTNGLNLNPERSNKITDIPPCLLVYAVIFSITSSPRYFNCFWQLNVLSTTNFATSNAHSPAHYLCLLRRICLINCQRTNFAKSNAQDRARHDTNCDEACSPRFVYPELATILIVLSIANFL